MDSSENIIINRQELTNDKIQKCIEALQSNQLDNCRLLLKDLCDMLDKQFSFDPTTKKLHEDLVSAICNKLTLSNDVEENPLILRCLMLKALRIFSRDKALAMRLSNKNVISMLFEQVGYHNREEEAINASEGNERDNEEPPISQQLNYADDNDEQIQTIVESQKCLCNLIYQNTSARAAVQAINGLQGICNHLRLHHKFTYDVKLYDLRLLFLLSALPPQQRTVILEECDGLKLIIDQVLRCIRDDVDKRKSNVSDLDQQQEQSNQCSSHQYPLSDECMSLVSESLRVLFNITLELQNQTCNEEDLGQIALLIKVIRKYIINIKTDMTTVFTFQKDIVNLFVNIPSKLLSELLILSLNNQEGNNEEDITETAAYYNQNMIIILGLMRFLESRLPDIEMLSQQSRDSLKPILTLLCSLCRTNRYIRKYLKLKLLPPRKDFTKRPEEGKSLKSRLIALLTSPWDVKNLVEDFLFVLCKENADRFIKHTGYGNAAGMLLSRGLLAGDQTSEAANFSSDDTDSDTEEYREQHDKIDPVTGAIKADNPNIFEGMTEEEIEKEAEQLFTLFKKLNDHGIIRPVDRSGQPINLPDPSIFKKPENEDSDHSDS